jgi:predicted nucleic acid-binding protein
VPPPIFKVVLDASVLFPLALCDTLLRAAEAGFYQPYWSGQILAELERALVRERACTAAGARRRVSAMRDCFPEALVTGFEHLTGAMRNDPDDRHVAAAAISAGAQVIVTSNLKHFRREDLAPSLEAQSPGSFLTSLLSLRTGQMLRILQEQATDLENPPMTVEELINGLALSVPDFAAAARELLSAQA